MGGGEGGERCKPRRKGTGRWSSMWWPQLQAGGMCTEDRAVGATKQASVSTWHFKGTPSSSVPGTIPTIAITGSVPSPPPPPSRVVPQSTMCSVLLITVHSVIRSGLHQTLITECLWCVSRTT